MKKPQLFSFPAQTFEVNLNDEDSEAKAIPIFTSLVLPKGNQAINIHRVSNLNNEFTKKTKESEIFHFKEGNMNNKESTINQDSKNDNFDLKITKSEINLKTIPTIHTLREDSKSKCLPFRKIKKFNKLAHKFSAFEKNKNCEKNKNKNFEKNKNKNKNLKSIVEPGEIEDKFKFQFKVKLEPMMKKENKYARSRSLDEFLESQRKFSTCKEAKIAHQVQIKFKDEEKIKTQIKIKINPKSKFACNYLKSSPYIKNNKKKSNSESPLTSDRKTNLTSSNKKVRLSEFQNYVKDHLQIKKKSPKVISQQLKTKERKSHNNILLKKMMKDIDSILMKNQIYSNQITFKEMQLILENLGFIIKNSSQKKKNRALNFIWNSVNLNGENTISLKDFKLALIALYNIKAPDDTYLKNDQSESKNSKYDFSTNDSFESVKGNRLNINYLKFNYIGRNKRSHPNLELKDTIPCNNLSREKMDEMISRVKNKINEPPSIEKVLKTRSDLKLNLNNHKDFNSISETNFSQISKPKFKILDKISEIVKFA